MPRLDGKGPRGEGSMTGRGLGNCNEEVNNDNENAMPIGRGLGMGRGLGRGPGRGLRRASGRGLRGGFGRGKW